MSYCKSFKDRPSNVKPTIIRVVFHLVVLSATQSAILDTSSNLQRACQWGGYAGVLLTYPAKDWTVD